MEMGAVTSRPMQYEVCAPVHASLALFDIARGKDRLLGRNCHAVAVPFHKTQSLRRQCAHSRPECFANHGAVPEPRRQSTHRTSRTKECHTATSRESEVHNGTGFAPGPAFETGI